MPPPGPLPDRGLEILLSTVTIAILATLVLIWRVVYGIMTKRKLLLCDYLLIVAAILNFTTMVIRFKTVDYALGRHIYDPSIKMPEDIINYSYSIYLNTVINLMAVAILKYSICAYLLALKFSWIYNVVVWLSILMVTVFVLLLPFLANVSCTPFESNWNRAIPKESCWYKGPMGLTYMQGVSNCLTDAVYVIAPIIYLRSIQLPRRTQWGLRIVFLLGIVATICSIFKTIELQALLKTQDPTWDGVDLTIWAATELNVGILVASLPPLRKQFDRLFQIIIPSTGRTRSKTPGGNSHPLYNFSGKFNTNVSAKNDTRVSRKSVTAHDHDDTSSERQILDDEERRMGDGMIVKTVGVQVTSSERTPSERFGP
ncbi:hypothetical protein M011DRAFT_393212 [Sporormia fimetaria CBS 119925]|uniref:Rhodopsin domain-containing protein n=1 Tax=Sporormia fimetaria CBS 119925 TaxID=1340428 RepID=A0A6A6VNC7_9PLEO|nr:hypothetical protein M011DRAFT_393212 [Sporormia fimetaria CBS 119925]